MQIRQQLTCWALFDPGCQRTLTWTKGLEMTRKSLTPKHVVVGLRTSKRPQPKARAFSPPAWRRACHRIATTDDLRNTAGLEEGLIPILPIDQAAADPRAVDIVQLVNHEHREQPERAGVMAGCTPSPRAVLPSAW